MTIRMGINGFGRIGRGVFRAGFGNEAIEFVGINDITSVEILAHLLKYDSTHGTFPYPVSVKGNNLVVDGKIIPVFSLKNPADIPWDSVDTDIVVECTGFFRTYDDAAKHLKPGVKNVIISAPSKGGPVSTFVMGVNESEFSFEKHKVISNASCTTNCYAPVTKVLDEKFGIEQGFMTTVHSYTGDQRILDAPHKDLRRARSAAVSIIPTTTGSAKAVGAVLPHLDGKLDAIAIRVPSPNVSIIDAVYTLKNETTVDEVNEIFKEAAEEELKDILAVSNEPLVSIDYNGDPHSAIVDLLSTKVMGNKVKIVAWYDNETGYSHRMIDLARYISK